ncbi:MAG: YihY/virulence factor BrkB family protein [Deltaproteobacteria bacterium]|nr:YihY/virulence factor BrkB family protein [Deltaproteobacteria bacterium]
MWKRKISKANQFIQRDIWRIRAKDLPQSKWFLVRFLRVVLLTVRGINEDRCQLRASALTFYSLLSIVPVVAMVFGVAKGFGFEKTIEAFFYEKFEGENAFNDIWGVKKPRSFSRKVTDYLSLMLITPVLFIISSTMTVMITSGAKMILQKIAILGVLGPAIFLFLKMLLYCVFWILFSFIYIFIPNTKVHFRSGILAGIIGGTIYEIFQWFYINFQIVVAKYNAIYGSFAALPLFFIWLQISWIIVLFGAEIAFAHQNVDTYEFEEDCLGISHSFKMLLSLRVTHLVIKNFKAGERPRSAEEISHKLDIPIRLINQILYELTMTGIISEISTDETRGLTFQPAIDPEVITIKYVIDALEEQGANNIPVDQSEEIQAIGDHLDAFSRMIDESPANKCLKDI